MKRFMMLVLSVFIFALMASCSENGGGSTEEIFKSVRAYAAYDTEAYTADVGEGEDSDNPKVPNEGCDAYFYFEDEVLVTITSTPIANLPMEPSPLKLLSYTVNFIAHEDSPDVPSKTIYHHIEIEPGSSIEIPIRIIDQEDKVWSSPHPLNHFDFCQWRIATAGVSYEYTVNVEMRLVEVTTRTHKTLELNFPLYYFDVAEDECWSSC